MVNLWLGLGRGPCARLRPFCAGLFGARLFGARQFCARLFAAWPSFWRGDKPCISICQIVQPCHQAWLRIIAAQVRLIGRVRFWLGLWTCVLPCIHAIFRPIFGAGLLPEFIAVFWPIFTPVFIPVF